MQLNLERLRFWKYDFSMTHVPSNGVPGKTTFTITIQNGVKGTTKPFTGDDLKAVVDAVYNYCVQEKL